MKGKKIDYFYILFSILFMSKRDNNVLFRKIEEENENQIDDLCGKIGELQNLSLEIKDYLKGEKDLLVTMENNYSLT